MILIDDPQAGVGQRLRLERERLEMSVTEMGTRAGKNRQTQMRYENGMNSPTAAYLHQLEPLGVDIGYVLTGFPSELHDDEASILAQFRAASPELRRAALSVLGSAAAAVAASGSIVGGDNSGQVNAGPVTQGDVSFQVGSKNRRGSKPSS
jgi:transcriptional regulator with XRE-family HTH domain